MKFAMFFLAEYANMITASALIARCSFGGWDVPFTTWDNTAPWSVWKTLATFARSRQDRLLPVLLHLGAVDGAALPYDQLCRSAGSSCCRSRCVRGRDRRPPRLDALGVARGSLVTRGAARLNVVLLGLVFVLLDRGRLISPASARAREDEVRRPARARARPRGGRPAARASDAAGD
jgi:NADH-quinone oxidoreductase subunit H